MILAEISNIMFAAIAFIIFAVVCLLILARELLWPPLRRALFDKEENTDDVDPKTRLQREIDEEIARENEGEDPVGPLQRILQGKK